MAYFDFINFRGLKVTFFVFEVNTRIPRNCDYLISGALNPASMKELVVVGPMLFNGLFHFTT